jgi:hypothetical protein
MSCYGYGVPRLFNVIDILRLREEIQPFLIPFGEAMSPNTLVELIEGLVTSETGIVPPFTVVVPYNTNLEQQFIDGIDDLGTLRERIIRVKNVKGIEVGSGNGVTLKHYEG